MQYAIAALIVICIVLFMIVCKQTRELDDLSDKYFIAKKELSMTKSILKLNNRELIKLKQMYTESERVRKKLCEEVNTNEKTQNG